MNIDEYAKYDAFGLAELVSRSHVSPKELAEAAARAMEAINPAINAVVETYPDRIDSLDEKTLGDGPFRGVPFLMKDVFGHEAGRKIEFGSRLCKDMIVQTDTHYCQLLQASGVNILGRSAAPEFSMSGTTEGALYGNTSTPWKRGYSAGGSTGGGMAAVIAGIVPIAHGSDIAGSIRIPASRWNSRDFIAVSDALVRPADRRATGNYTRGRTCDPSARRGARGSNAVERPPSAVTCLNYPGTLTDVGRGATKGSDHINEAIELAKLSDR